MSETINIYCDESCHIENDRQKAMVLGCLICPESKAIEIAKDIRNLKKEHKIPPFAEIKWKKVSKSKELFYIDLLDYFLNNKDLNFRALVFANKDKYKLEHEKYNQTYDDWYYKMFYITIYKILGPFKKYNIYLDKKNPNSNKKLKKLSECLGVGHKIKKIQNVLSHQVEQIQLADFLIGLISYLNRQLYLEENPNLTKVKLIDIFRTKIDLPLIKTTPMFSNKVNLLFWEPSHYEK